MSRDIDPRSGKLPGLAAVALFALLAYVFLGSGIGAGGGGGFPNGNVTASIGYAMFDLTGQASTPSEGFLAAFEIIDVVLVAALVGAVMLARRRTPGMTSRDDDEGGER